MSAGRGIFALVFITYACFGEYSAASVLTYMEPSQAAKLVAAVEDFAGPNGPSDIGSKLNLVEFKHTQKRLARAGYAPWPGFQNVSLTGCNGKEEPGGILTCSFQIQKNTKSRVIPATPETKEAKGYPRYERSAVITLHGRVIIEVGTESSPHKYIIEGLRGVEVKWIADDGSDGPEEGGRTSAGGE